MPMVVVDQLLDFFRLQFDLGVFRSLAGPRDLSSAYHKQIRGLEQLNGATPDFLPFLVRVRRFVRDAMLVGDLRD